MLPLLVILPPFKFNEVALNAPVFNVPVLNAVDVIVPLTSRADVGAVFWIPTKPEPSPRIVIIS